MSIPEMIMVVLLASGAAAVGFLYAVRRSADAGSQFGVAADAVQDAVDQAVQRAVTQVHEQSVAQRDAAVHAALQHTAVLQREQMAAATERHQAQLDTVAARVTEHSTAELGAKKDVIDARLDQVHDEMRTELANVVQMLQSLGQTSAQKFGEVENSLRAHAEVTATLSESAQTLRSALANPQARGQWGERMAEDVLRLAGFVEHVNYEKQTQIDGGTGRPDFTFKLPKGQTLFMDVKFPMAAYLRYLDAHTDAEREAHLKRFLSDVRARVKELSKREYGNEGRTTVVGNVLLFIPNEQLTGFIHEHDPALLDDAMSQQVVMCSPLTLFAFLGVIRQAHDNFMIEQTSDEILQLIGTFGKEWEKYVEQADRVKKKFDSVEREFDLLVGRRRRVLEKPLQQLDDIRRKRNLPIDGELFALHDVDDSDTPSEGFVRELGA